MDIRTMIVARMYAAVFIQIRMLNAILAKDILAGGDALKRQGAEVGRLKNLKLSLTPIKVHITEASKHKPV